MRKTLRITVVTRRQGGNVAIGFDLGGTEFETARACRALKVTSGDLSAAPCPAGIEIDPRRIDAALAEGGDQFRQLAAYWRTLDGGARPTVLAAIA